MLRLFSYILPAFLEVTVPMALLLAILVAFGRLSSDSEIIALRAAGHQPLSPAACRWRSSPSIVALLTLGLSLYARPWGNTLLRTGLYEIVKTRAVRRHQAEGLQRRVQRAWSSTSTEIQPASDGCDGILISDTRDPSHAQHGLRRDRPPVQQRGPPHASPCACESGGIYSAGDDRTQGYQDTRFTTYDITLDLERALAQLRNRERRTPAR